MYGREPDSAFGSAISAFYSDCIYLYPYHTFFCYYNSVEYIHLLLVEPNGGMRSHHTSTTVRLVGFLVAAAMCSPIKQSLDVIQ